MPIYEYRCENCGKLSEFLFGVAREEVKLVCGHCGSGKLQKIFSRNFVSKGGDSKRLPDCGTCCSREGDYSKAPCFNNGICGR